MHMAMLEQHQANAMCPKDHRKRCCRERFANYQSVFCYSDESYFRDMQLYNQLLFTMSLWAAAQMQSSKDADVTNVNAGMSVCHSRSCWRIPEVVYPLSISKSLWHALLCILHHKHDHRRTNVFVIMHNENMLINYSAST